MVSGGTRSAASTTPPGSTPMACGPRSRRRRSAWRRLPTGPGRARTGRRPAPRRARAADPGLAGGRAPRVSSRSPETGPAAGPAGDPRPLARLYPPAFPDDPDAEAAWATSSAPGSTTPGADRAGDRMAATLDADELDDAAAAAWLGVLNDLRLVLGRSSTSREDEPPPARAGDPDAMRGRSSTISAGWSRRSSTRWPTRCPARTRWPETRGAGALRPATRYVRGERAVPR